MTRRIHAFGDCIIDPAARELRRFGRPVPLSPKVFDCIAYLIEHRDRAIGRDELAAAIWGKADVTDGMLGQVVVKARRVVGDTGDDQSAIRTIPRFGYRWVAAVEALPSQGDDSTRTTGGEELAPQQVPTALDASTSLAEAFEPQRSLDDTLRRPEVTQRPDLPTRTAWRSTIAHPSWWMLALAIAAVVAVGVWRERGDRDAAPIVRGTVAPSAVMSDAVAVLPVDVPATEDAAWVRLGVMDLIAGRLQSAGLAVVPSENVAVLVRGAKGPLASIVPEATGARYLVSPTALKTEKEWVFRLHWHSLEGEDHDSEMRDADVITAARKATDNLLLLLGRSSPEGHSEAVPSELLSRARAALLVDDLEGARRLLDSVPADQRQSPERDVLLAQVDYRSGRFDNARQRLQELRSKVSAEASPVLRARIMNGLGAVLARVDSPENARRAFVEALALLENRNEPAELGRAYSGRAISYAMEGRYDLASSDFAQARIALQLSADALALALLESNEGILEIRRNHQATALPLLERAAASLGRMGALSGLAIAVAEMVEAQLAMLEPERALAAADEIWPRFNHQDTPPKRLLAYKRARALTAVGRLSDARAALNEVQRTLDPAQESALLAEIRMQQALLDVHGSRPDTALILSQQAVDGLSSPEDARQRGFAWLILTRVLRMQGHVADAAAEMHRFSQWSQGSGDVTAATYAGLAEAEQAAAENQAGAAIQHYEQALRAALKDGVPADIAEIVASYADFLFASNELADASVVVGKVARWADSDFMCALLQARLYHALGQREAWSAAFDQAQKLAGERSIPVAIRSPPPRSTLPEGASPK